MNKNHLRSKKKYNNVSRVFELKNSVNANWKNLFSLGFFLFNILLVFTGCSKLTNPLIKMDLEQFIEVEFSGTDNKGEAEYKFDYNSFNDEYGEEIYEVVINDGEEYTEYFTTEDAAEYFFYECVHIHFDKEENLSNGDDITLKIDVKEEIAESVFNVEVESSEMKYTVEGLDYYVTDFSEISEEDMDMLIQESKDKLNAYSYESWADEWTLTDIEYEYSYLLNRKPTSKRDWGNKFFMVFKLTAEYDYADGSLTDHIEYYTTVLYNDLMIQDDEFFVNISSGYISAHGFVREYEIEDSVFPLRYEFYGYDTLDQLEKREVGHYITDYTYIKSND